MNRWDLIIVGAGAVGAAAFRAASEAGSRVLCLEQFTPASERGSSHGHSRIFRHAYFEHPDYVPLLRHSTTRFASLERESGTPLLHRCGMLVVGPTGSPVVSGSLGSARRWGLQVSEFGDEELTGRFPWFRFPSGSHAAFEADAGFVRSEATVHASIALATARGGELRRTSRVFSITDDDNGVVIRTDGAIERASTAIVAAGPWTAGLLPELAPLLSVTRQVQAWIEPTPGTDTAGMPCWYLDRGEDVRPVYGLAPDPFAATDGPAVRSRHPKIGLHGSNEIVDPALGARPVDDLDHSHLRRACEAAAPALAGRLADACTCLYTMSPDGQFLLGTRSGGRTHFAAGLSGHGFKLSPALGDALVDLALAGRTALPVGFLSPDRFATGPRA